MKGTAVKFYHLTRKGMIYFIAVEEMEKRIIELEKLTDEELEEKVKNG